MRLRREEAVAKLHHGGQLLGQDLRLGEPEGLEREFGDPGKVRIGHRHRAEKNLEIRMTADSAFLQHHKTTKYMDLFYQDFYHFFKEHSISYSPLPKGHLPISLKSLSWRCLSMSPKAHSKKIFYLSRAFVYFPQK